MSRAPNLVPRIRVDTRKLRQRIEIAKRSGDQGATEGARVMAAAFVDFVLTTSPQDTNRYVNGWIEAARDVRATQRTPLPIQESRSRNRILAALEGQVRRLDKKAEQLETVLDRWYYTKGRTGPWLRKKEAELRRLHKRRERAAEELAKFIGAEGAIAIDLYGRKGAKTQRLTTVRTKVYGGVGAIIHAGGARVVRLHNLEPHATFVERRTRVVARAVAVLRSAGLRRAGTAYLRKQAAAGGLKLGAGQIVGGRGLPAEEFSNG